MRIAIASGKGGTGKTFVSTNLFNVLRKNNQRVCLVDCDAEEPNDMVFIGGVKEESFEVTQKVPIIDESKCQYCGKCHDYCNYNAIFFLKEPPIIKAMHELCHGCGACSVACEYGAITEIDDLLGNVTRFKVDSQSSLIESRVKVGVYSPVRVIKKAVKEANEADVVLLDSPPGTSCPFIQTVVNADFVVLVTEPTPFGLSDLMQSVDTLKSIGKRCGVIINRAGMGNDDVYEYLRIEEIPLLMSVPFDRTIASSYSRGELITDIEEEWANKFNQLYSLIVESHANSRY